MVVDFGEAWGCSNVIVRRILGWIGHRLGFSLPQSSDQLAYLVAYPCATYSDPSRQHLCGHQTLSKSRWSRWYSSLPQGLLFRLTQLAFYRHAANVVVFPYCEWWASRYQLAPCQVRLTVN